MTTQSSRSTCTICKNASATMRVCGEAACRSCYEANVAPWNRSESDALDAPSGLDPPTPIIPAALTRPVEDASSYMKYLEQGASSSIWSWSLTPYELRQQVEHYQTLPATQSYRGIAALVTLGFSLFTIAVALFGLIAADAAWGIVIYGPIAWFIYRGHRWAMVAMMGLWTFEKAYTLYTRFPAGIGAVIFWYVFMKYYLAAFKVEQARREGAPQ